MKESIKPLVSIVIPCFNAARYIAEAIASIKCQSYDNVEVILVDDGSSDDSVLLAKNSGIEIQCIESAHQGISSARNRGVAASRGSLLAFMDADDILHCERLERQVEVFLTQTELDLCYSHSVNFQCEWSSAIAQERLTDSSVNKGCLCGTVMISRACWSMVGSFNETFKSGEFIEWYLRAQQKGVSVYCLEQILYYRRIHAHNYSRLRSHYSEYARLLKKNLLATKR